MNSKIIERIKSIILVVLLLLTILLLYLVLMQNENVEISNLLPFKTVTEGASIQAADLVRPKEIIYTNENGEMTSTYDKTTLYQSICKYINEFSHQETSMVTEIEAEQYEAATTKSKSLQFNFAYSIPFKEFCQVYGINRTTGYSSIKEFDSIAISESAKDSVLFKNSKENKYYRIISETDDNLFEDVVANAIIEGDSIYPVAQVLGIKSNMYIPVQAKRNTEEVYCMYETYIEGSFAFEDIAESVFGETISFVRKIKDSFGTVTYMYGYGDKTLSIAADGKIEYKNTSLQIGESAGLYGDLQTAIEFINLWDGWSTQNSETELKLESIEVSGADKNTIYSFYFNQSLSDEKISGEDIFGMTVVVEKGQVSAMTRNNIIAIKSYAERENCTEVANAIAQIAPEKYEEYCNENNINVSQKTKEQDAIAYTVNEIVDIQSVYKMEGHFLIPSWEILFKDGSKEWIGLKQKQF